MRDIDKLLSAVLKSSGFRLKNSSWYRLTNDFIQIINFQKSYYSNLYYLNFGIDSKTGNDNFYKPIGQFPVRWRIESIISNTDLILSLDFESDIPETERLERLNTILKQCVDILNSISCYNELKSALETPTHPIQKAAIWTSFARQGIPTDSQ